MKLWRGGRIVAICIRPLPVRRPLAGSRVAPDTSLALPLDMAHRADGRLRVPAPQGTIQGSRPSSIFVGIAAPTSFLLEDSSIFFNAPPVVASRAHLPHRTSRCASISFAGALSAPAAIPAPLYLQNERRLRIPFLVSIGLSYRTNRPFRSLPSSESIKNLADRYRTAHHRDRTLALF